MKLSLSIILVMSILFPALVFADDNSMQNNLSHRYLYGDCEYMDGKCYRPKELRIQGDPAILQNKMVEDLNNSTNPLVLWRIDYPSMKETMIEIDRDDLPPLFDRAINPLPDHYATKSNQRTKITNTKEYPYSSVLKLYMSIPNSMYGAMCSGMMGPGRNVALSAGHCLYNNDRSQGPVGALNVEYIIPAMNGQFNNPFGYTTPSESWIPDQWKNPNGGSEFNYDWSVMRLARDIGDRTGWMEIVTSNAPDSYFTRSTVHVLGYPGDLEEGNYMYHVQGTIFQIYGNIFYHDAYTYQGNSGGPNYFILGDESNPTYEIVGIVSHGVEYQGQLWNGSTMIKSGIMAAISEAADCEDECEESVRECQDDSTWRICKISPIGCLLWQTEECGENESCVQDGQCKACANECELGRKECIDDSEIRECIEGDEGCTVWEVTEQCSLNEYCTRATCVERENTSDGDDNPDSSQCEGQCDPDSDSVCLSNEHSICECKGLQWTINDCIAVCAAQKLSFSRCGFHPGKRMDACICNDDGSIALPDGDDNDDDDNAAAGTGSGCQSGPNSSALFLLLMGALVFLRRQEMQ